MNKIKNITKTSKSKQCTMIKHAERYNDTTIQWKLPRRGSLVTILISHAPGSPQTPVSSAVFNSSFYKAVLALSFEKLLVSCSFTLSAFHFSVSGSRALILSIFSSNSWRWIPRRRRNSDFSETQLTMGKRRTATWRPQLSWCLIETKLFWL